MDGLFNTVVLNVFYVISSLLNIHTCAGDLVN